MGNLSDKPWLVPGHMYQYDIGWLVDKILSFETELNTAIDLKTIHYADPIQWDITTQYAPNTVVVDPKTGTAYMSKVPIPSGILLTNTDYWVVIFNYQRIYDKIMSGVAFNDKDNLNASKDLLVNDLVWYGGDLYRCTRAIPEGTTYIPGTNLTPTTIADCLATYYGRDRVAQVLNDTVNVLGDYTLNAGDAALTASNLTLHSTKDTHIDADGNLTEQVTGGKTSEIGGKLTVRVTGSREIDVDGDDSLHVDGVTSVNRGGAVTEVYGSSVNKRVTGAFTENFEDTATSTFNGKRIVKAKDVDATVKNVELTAESALIHFPTKTVDLEAIGKLTDFIDVTNCEEYGLESISKTDDTNEMTRKFQDILNYATDTRYVIYIPGMLELNITKVTGTRVRYILSYGSINGDIDLNYDSTQRIAQWYQINAVYGTITLRGFKTLTMFLNYANKFVIEGDGSNPTLMSTAYCSFYMQSVKDFLITGHNKGWVNENKFYGLRCNNLTIESTDNDYHHNHNVFYGFVFEHTNVNIKNGSFNVFHDCRLETAGATDNSLTIASSCYDNMFYRSWYSSPSPFYDILQSGITVDDNSRETFFLNTANQAIKNFFIYNLSPDTLPSGMTYENNQYKTSTFVNKVIGNLVLDENLYITINGRFGIQLYDINHNKYTGDLDSHINLGRGLSYNNGFISIGRNVKNYKTAILVEKGVGTYYGEIVMYISGNQTLSEYNLTIDKKYNLVTP